nr:hypothetical protein [Tanacetum cinerariifolium]
MNVDEAKENVGSLIVQQTEIQCFNCKEFGHFTKECRKPKRVKDSTYHKEKMLLCKQAEKEMDDSNAIPDSPNMCDNDIQNDQNAVECDDERVALANLITNLKLDVDENKKIQRQLKKANTTLAQELKECKSILAETSKTLRGYNSIRDSCLVALQNKHTEFEKYNASQDSDNIIKTQTTTTPNVDIPHRMDTSGSHMRQETMGGTPAQTRSERVLEPPNEPPLLKGMMIGEIDKDENVNLVQSSEQGKAQETAEHRMEFSTASPQTDDDETLTETLLNIKRSTTKDKGKGIMQETKLPKKIKKREMTQLSLDEELAQKLHAKELAKETVRQEQEKYNLKKALEFQK